MREVEAQAGLAKHIAFHQPPSSPTDPRGRRGIKGLQLGHKLLNQGFLTALVLPTPTRLGTPTTPEQLRYSNWPTSVASAWDYTDPGSTSDSSTVYFWGFANPLTLGPGASATFRQYVTTEISAVGGGPVTNQIPTMTQLGCCCSPVWLLV